MVFESVLEEIKYGLHIYEGIRNLCQDYLQHVSLRINTPSHQIFMD